jgi:hypothetical protein
MTMLVLGIGQRSCLFLVAKIHAILDSWITLETVTSDPVFSNPESISPLMTSTFEPSISSVGVSLVKLP